jgi:hypothetical protein
MPDSAEPSTPLDDPRLQFFLEHEEQIRDWASLALEVFDAVESTLRELALELQADPRIIEERLRVGEQVNGEAFRAPVLYRDTWCLMTPDLPDVGIGLGWDGRSVDPAGIWRPSSLPYVGLRTSHQTDAGRACEEKLRALQD